MLSVMEYSLQNTHIVQAKAMAEEKGAKQLVIYKTSRAGGKLPQQLGHQGSLRVSENEV